MTDITELAQSLKEAAEKATPGQWVAFTDTATKTFAVHTPNDKRCENIIKWAGFDCQKNAKANAEFIALANPANALALVEALEKAQRANSAQDDHINQQEDRIEQLEKGNQYAAKRLAELESRTVTVKLPESFKLAKSSSGLRYYYADEVDAALTAAGIKVEDE